MTTARDAAVRGDGGRRLVGQIAGPAALGLLALVTGGVGIAMMVAATDSGDRTAGTLVALTGVVVGLLASVVYSMSDLARRIDRYDDHALALASAGVAETARDEEGRPVSRSQEATLRVDRYLIEANHYQRRSFAVAQYASILGFVVVLIPVVAIVIRPAASVIAVGAISTVSAMLTAFMSRTFYVTYGQATAQWMSYFVHCADSDRLHQRVDLARDLLRDIDDASLRDQGGLELVKLIGVTLYDRQTPATEEA